MNRLHSTLTSWRERIVPINHVSSFDKTGTITPEEFVQAGDYLVYKFPTWKWEAGDPARRREFLPVDKQYLVTKHVPCIPGRSNSNDNEAEQLEDDWYTTPSIPHSSESVHDIDSVSEHSNPILSIEEEDAEHDPSAAPHTLQTRTYDLHITYDKWYQTPRLWLFGWSETQVPLGPNDILQDIQSDYASKTVTIESFPNIDMQMATVHPCRHAEVMLSFIKRSDNVRVDQYLLLFLKFMASVMPTIEHDQTMGF
ncbi:Autophagy-related protein 3 [Neolecta irregularis DAH-3]|uniref:Autophagy-related protein 3 n=1 Tax=Neolecta irregularis (strain DAH-3) TaxID=1198029 RepID=A0A1U7LWI4_NEOID|nr:Autophagy-related protein 3 [Neolecta irregularis DAH-3]|eukprot:OLL27040.1 Autophagy-related protein 3 [Neolecta irregularis DAH-3]